MLSFSLQDLTFQEVLASVPTEPGSIFAMFLIFLYIGLTWWGSRPRRTEVSASADEPVRHPSASLEVDPALILRPRASRKLQKLQPEPAMTLQPDLALTLESDPALTLEGDPALTPESEPALTRQSGRAPTLEDESSRKRPADPARTAGVGAGGDPMWRPVAPAPGPRFDRSTTPVGRSRSSDARRVRRRRAGGRAPNSRTKVGR